ncbi:phosphatidylinositol transfer protein [Pseudoalteromonas rubra]|uniref:Phosphatidylinositol transfer protein n=1 Tax=Pseudoalteromonas rubra TaxID=43658 RepID=A0A5S3WQ95_9GAMM|nr:phosphatidylinositol transfer protein [Pseudoalteromonas rubra]TMP30790.1 phosphatidylinositol transfer protein [Pseudoalteromonas rubra]TMP34158.1 phosphatidylinositol transfer protein [Pseudoalteromonas rubra]
MKLSRLAHITAKTVAAAAIAWSVGAQALPQCPDPSWIEQNYAKPEVPSAGYRNGLNRFITWLPSFHMVHDEVVAEGNSVTVTAKFDYGAIAHKDLEFETVRFYLRGQQDSDWHYLGDAVTNSDGKASVTLSAMNAGQYRIYAAVPADGTGAEGFVTVVQPNTPAVLFDIDGTLTESDAEQIGDYTGIDRADQKEGAYSLVRRYLDLGYQPVYLTARVYWYAKGTRDWLNWMGLPRGFLRTSLSNETSLFRTAEYKIEQIQQLQSQGLNIVRAYGNAKTDAEAFIRAGLGAQNSFTIGPDAGHYGTTAISNNNYYSHITNEVDTYPAAQCE